jgi:putative AlgH/UPF0301 family transcriptional regulator
MYMNRTFFEEATFHRSIIYGIAHSISGLFLIRLSYSLVEKIICEMNTENINWTTVI